MPIGQQESGAEGAAKGVTSTVSQPCLSYAHFRAACTYTDMSKLGNAAGGLSKTLGGVVGATGKGIGNTINDTTGTKAAGDGLQGVTGGIEDGANSAGKGAENAGQWKK
ncbi:hypothetical protein LTR27_005249 [Elasticomyces elasticus]|nr:hypothetical protein LTR27_005249 [Elasticomyces elasticus]